MTGRTISIRSTIFPDRGLHISWSFWLLLAAALLAAPPSVTAAVLLAAVMHEGGHLALLAAFRVPVDGLRLGGMGAVIYAPGAARLSYGRELAVTLAGPVVNLLSAPLIAALSSRLAWEWGYLLAGAHMLLGVYNLLPIPPLDGGRALWLLVAWRFGPDAADRAGGAAALTAALALALGGVWMTFAHGGALFLLASFGLLAGVLRQRAHSPLFRKAIGVKRRPFTFCSAAVSRKPSAR